MPKGVSKEQNVIDDILGRAEVLWLALTDADGPHCVPVNFVHEGDVLFVHSGPAGRKRDCLQSGRPLAFSAAVDVKLKNSDENACNVGYYFKSVMGDGIPRETAADEKMRGLDLLTLKYAGREMPYKDKVLGITTVFAIDIRRITARIK